MEAKMKITSNAPQIMASAASKIKPNPGVGYGSKANRVIDLPGIRTSGTVSANKIDIKI